MYLIKGEENRNADLKKILLTTHKFHLIIRKIDFFHITNLLGILLLVRKAHDC